MALGTTLIANGLHHARSDGGSITIGPAYGQVAGLGNNQLLKVLLPFSKPVYTYPGFEDQTYITAEPLDNNVTAMSLDAQQFEYDPTTGAPVLRFRVDIAAAPAGMELLVVAEHSATR